MRGYLVKKGVHYYAVVYEGTDPLTREERRTWRAAGTSRREAERFLAELVQARNTRCAVFPARMSLASYLVDHWLPTRRSTAPQHVRTLRARDPAPHQPADRSRDVEPCHGSGSRRAVPRAALSASSWPSSPGGPTRETTTIASLRSLQSPRLQVRYLVQALD
jgi:hypothetical protein